MDAQNENDNAELFEFYKRLVTFNLSELNSVRENTFILCFTEHANSYDMWEQYANKDKGACIEFEFILKKKHKCFDLRKIFYDNGYDIDFYQMLFINFIEKWEYFSQTLAMENLPNITNAINMRMKKKQDYPCITQMISNYLERNMI